MDPLSGRQRALAFVLERGDAFARARARAFTGQCDPRRMDGFAEIDAERLDLQRAARLLGICADLRVLGIPLVRDTCRQIAGRQGENGAWCAREAGEDEDLFLTGALGGSLAKTRYARPELLEAAGSFLSDRWSPDRLKSGDHRYLAAYAHFFANVDHERSDEILQWCGRELERAFRTRRFDALRTTRILLDSDAPSLPGARFEQGELFVALISEQALDGSFGGDVEISARVERTLDGLCALGLFSDGA